MDMLIAAAARALSSGDPLAVLKRVALRNDAPALALRGIAMAQLGDLARARELLKDAARAFGPDEPMARARCMVAEAEIALVCRDLGRSFQTLGATRATLEAGGDQVNAAHAGYLEARQLLLIGRLEDAQRTLDSIDIDVLPPASRAGYGLVVAGIAMRQIRTGPARAALQQAARAAQDAGIPSLKAEVEKARHALEAPAARLVSRDRQDLLQLDRVEALVASDTFIVDTCRNAVRLGEKMISLDRRPVLLALARALAEVWPEDVSRENLLMHAFGAKHVDDSHRARLRVEIARLRKVIKPVAGVRSTSLGFALKLHGAHQVAVLAPPVESDHPEVLALLADGEAWSSSALALALGVSPRTVQRKLEDLALAGKVRSFGRGRACRWILSSVPGFPTSLLLPLAIATG
ncbi:helix-turn-helix domain-containing protein (plasmid) [Labrenzia sp. 5N]|jgi:tetratricopeptide (TPR) repeat protein|uniref:helix-turn-helix domain-containing protein n=1 Tax=Labrenzia sp. 5N TaxID=2723402 RepID=UPI001445B12A|nr:helix-turn-helix domain-containing protein [Labrenzia sp. 5N]NKX67862.1 helix-turn-helix domain-containing protein [Labrenzia sp. 5N]